MMTLFPYFSSQFLLLVNAGFLDVRLDPGEVFVVDGTVSVVGEVVVCVVAALAADDLQHKLLVLSSICVYEDSTETWAGGRLYPRNGRSS